MRPPVRRVGDRQPFRRDRSLDAVLAPPTTRVRPQRIEFGQDWNVAYRKEGRLPPASLAEVSAGFSISAGGYAQELRDLERLSSEPGDGAADAFLRARGYGPDGEKFDGARTRAKRRRRVLAQTCDHADCLQGGSLYAQDGPLHGPVRVAQSTAPATCYLCGADLVPGYHMDHVIPLARGGEHCALNLEPTCAPCNLRKGDRLLSELPWSRGGGWG